MQHRSEHNTPVHIALIGFMGAGKSTVGPKVAQALGCSFIDLDAMILQRASVASVAEIFRVQGEVAFRAHERAALRDALASTTPVVLATGGGTFIDPTAREALLSAARCVFLRTELKTVLARVGHDAGLTTRPLLAGPDAAATAARLYEQRQGIYAECPYSVDTDGHTAEAVAQRVMETLGAARSSTRDSAAHMARRAGAVLSIAAGTGTYPVEMRPGAGAWLANATSAAVHTQRWAVISDNRVASLHAAAFVENLRAAGKTVTLHVFDEGEDSKVIATAATLYDALLEAGIGRHDALVALGGGVVGDVTGFVASTYMRGIAYVQVPTTTLAAVDSSVGGKTAVNTPRGKNLVGTFYPPQAVLLAASHLSTQTVRAHAAGLVEALKMAACYDAALFQHIVSTAPALLAFDADALLDVISRSIAIKAAVVSRDEREAGERAVLNWGHTLGHAIEKGEAYRPLHGEAVALGLVAETEWAVQAKLTPPGVLAALMTALSALNMPTDWRRAKLDVDALGLDKKRLGAEVKLPIVPKLGSFELHNVPIRALVEFCGP